MPSAPQGPPERQHTPPESTEQLPDASDGEYLSADAELHLALLPATGEAKVKGKAKAGVGEVLGMGVGGPAVILLLAPHANLSENWTGALILSELALVGWLTFKTRRKS